MTKQADQKGTACVRKQSYKAKHDRHHKAVKADLKGSVSPHRGTEAGCLQPGAGGVGGAAEPAASHTQSMLPRF